MTWVPVGVYYCEAHDGVANEDQGECDFFGSDLGDDPCMFRQLHYQDDGPLVPGGLAKENWEQAVSDNDRCEHCNGLMWRDEEGDWLHMPEAGVLQVECLTRNDDRAT